MYFKFADTDADEDADKDADRCISSLMVQSRSVTNNF